MNGNDLATVNAPKRESLHLARLLGGAAEKGILKKFVLSMPLDHGIKNASAAVIALGGETVLQFELLHKDGKATHKNIPAADTSAAADFIRGFLRANLILSSGESCEYRANEKGNAKVIGGAAIEARIAASAAAAPRRGNDREKSRLLSGNEEFLKALGVSSAEGRVYDKKQPKFRQICRFLEHLRDVEGYLPRDGVLRICDLCCGKSYLSFAVYYYFAVLKGRHVSMTGVDLKPDVIEYCSSVAAASGFDGLEFICGDVMEYDSSEHGAPQLVVSLHACDIATDIVLTRAAMWRARVILSTPCCHHALANVIDCPELSFVTKHPFLERKLCDVLTDAARLARLEAEGYDTTALELTDPEDTPKNVLLRAVLNEGASREVLEKKRAEYEAVRQLLIRSGNESAIRGALPDIIPSKQ